MSVTFDKKKKKLYCSVIEPKMIWTGSELNHEKTTRSETDPEIYLETCITLKKCMNVIALDSLGSWSILFIHFLCSNKDNLFSDELIPPVSKMNHNITNSDLKSQKL